MIFVRIRGRRIGSTILFSEDQCAASARCPEQSKLGISSIGHPYTKVLIFEAVALNFDTITSKY